jgi:hypothetical protein
MQQTFVNLLHFCVLFQRRQPKTTQAGHSAQTASGQGNMTKPTLVSFASLSEISGTL